MRESTPLELNGASAQRGEHLLEPIGLHATP
jgi:hypothetical protein